ncbi:MAG TPA: tetratricopeptide repeat protein [Spirochaetota bacterium]|nr:tetratricopeptide repeat protein [Spirochaetota bacterium]HPI90287.1 tetratricopeptide repeat protein [Spirochaetota bacterium]HPR46375.1 tetratricopeptide repeat protein [Spirochaetota bacterium]
MHSSSVPKEAVTIYNSALELSNRNDFESALKEYRRAIELHPDFIEAYNNMGEIYSRLGQKKDAIASYLDALRIDRNHRVLLNLGVEHYNNMNYESALKYFLDSLNVQPDFIEGNFYTGMVYYNFRNYLEAQKYFRTVVLKDKKHLKANYLLAYIYYEFKDYENTLKCLDNIKTIADDKAFINRYYGFCYYHLGMYEKAAEYLTTALKNLPQYAKFKSYIQSLTYENKLKEIGDIDQAIRDLEKKIMRDKPNLQEATRLSMLYIFKGKNKEAEDLLISLKKKIAS